MRVESAYSDVLIVINKMRLYVPFQNNVRVLYVRYGKNNVRIVYAYGRTLVINKKHGAATKKVKTLSIKIVFQYSIYTRKLVTDIHFILMILRHEIEYRFLVERHISNENVTLLIMVFQQIATAATR